MFQRLQSLIQQKFSNRNLRSKVQAAQVVEIAKKELKTMFGSDILTVCQPISIQNGVLSVAVLSSVVAEEIRLREKDIIRNIHSKIGDGVVIKIQFIR